MNNEIKKVLDDADCTLFPSTAEGFMSYQAAVPAWRRTLAKHFSREQMSTVNGYFAGDAESQARTRAVIESMTK